MGFLLLQKHTQCIRASVLSLPSPLLLSSHPTQIRVQEASEKVSPSLLLIQLLSPHWHDCGPGSLRMHSPQEGRSIASFEARRGCCFCLESLPHLPGLPIDLPALLWPSLPPLVPVTLSTVHCLINSPPPGRLFVCTLVILSSSALWYLFALDFC